MMGWLIVGYLVTGILFGAGSYFLICFLLNRYEEDQSLLMKILTYAIVGKCDRLSATLALMDLHFGFPLPLISTIFMYMFLWFPLTLYFMYKCIEFFFVREEKKEEN